MEIFEFLTSVPLSDHESKVDTLLQAEHRHIITVDQGERQVASFRSQSFRQRFFL